MALKHVIDQQCCALRHAAGSTNGAKSALFAAKRDYLFMLAITAYHTQETVVNPTTRQIIACWRWYQWSFW
jgi:hypothetical protein